MSATDSSIHDVHKLKTLRRERGLSQGSLGSAVGVSKFAICDYELRRRVPRPRVMRELIKFFDGQLSAADFYRVDE